LLDEDEEQEYLELLEEEERSQARASHLAFMEYCWMKKEPFIPGFHTRIICERIDKAFEDFRAGKCTYLKINVHHRSGKSDILSRYTPPHFLGEFPDCEVMSVSFKAALTEKFTAFARNIVKSPRYSSLYPRIGLSQESNAKAYWELVDKETGQPTFGKLFGSGLTSGITGSGGHLVLCDDPISGRAAAESSTIRENVWSAIADDLLTRLAPVHIVIFLMTTWHWDDPSGRISNAMAEDPDFPQFEELTFPAKAEDYRGEGTYPGKYLFLDRYPESWYRSQYAILGKYSASSLLDCNPMPRTGGMLSTEFITYVENMVVDNDKVWARVWDLAHTAVQRNGDDPDWTSGTKMAFERRVGEDVPYLYIADVTRTREGAVKRDLIIKKSALSDGAYVRQAVENTIDSKDAYEYISAALPEISWTKINGKGDKAARATPLEAIFATPGHVIVQKASWNDDWVDELMRFDGGGQDHDDQVDNLSAGYALLVAGASRFDEDTSAALAARRRRLR
jgi:predicted phage terminase large subunit-like protein